MTGDLKDTRVTETVHFGSDQLEGVPHGKFRRKTSVIRRVKHKIPHRVGRIFVSGKVKYKINYNVGLFVKP